MSNDQRNAEFSFLDFAGHSRTPRPAERLKNGSAAVSERGRSKPHANDSRGELLATAVIAALLICLAKFFGAP